MSNLENNTTELENLLNMTKNLPNAEDLVKVKSVNGQIGDVVLTAEDVQALPNTIDSLSYFKNDLNFANETYVNEIAGGKCKVYIKSFRSKTDPNYVTTSDEDVLEEWLKTVDKSQFNSGDIFLIRDTGVPDYWWDKDRQTIQILETTKIDLEGYLQQSDLAAAINEALAEAKASGEFRGDQGPEGPQGPIGPEGPTGPAGADGKTPIAGEDFLRPEDFDTTPIQGSSKPITSGGVYAALQKIPSGGGDSGDGVEEIFYVNGNLSVDGSFTADKTIEDITTALENSKTVIMKMYIGTVLINLPLVSIVDDDVGHRIIFSATANISEKIVLVCAEMFFNGENRITISEIPLTGDGAAAKEIFYVDGDFDAQTLTFSTNVTYEEIKAAVMSGKYVVGRANNNLSGGFDYMPISGLSISSQIAVFGGTLQAQGSALGLPHGLILLAVTIEVCNTGEVITRIKVVETTEIK